MMSKPVMNFQGLATAKEGLGDISRRYSLETDHQNWKKKCWKTNPSGLTCFWRSLFRFRSKWSIHFPGNSENSGFSKPIGCPQNCHHLQFNFQYHFVNFHNKNKSNLFQKQNADLKIHNPFWGPGIHLFSVSNFTALEPPLMPTNFSSSIPGDLKRHQLHWPEKFRFHKNPQVGWNWLKTGEMVGSVQIFTPILALWICGMKNQYCK